MFANLLIAAAVLLGLVAEARTGMHLDDVWVLVNEELDPVVSPNMQSSHMHKVIGGSRFGASYNYDDYSSSQCTSLAMQRDHSNYWMPTLYWIDHANNEFIPVPARARFYYFISQPGVNGTVEAFPKGLRMLTGDPNSKTMSSLMGFTCHPSGVDNYNNPDPTAGFNFDIPCNGGIKAEAYFPSCWDGVNLYKSDQSHMAWPQLQPMDGGCPLSHPIKVPTIMLEYTYHIETVAPVNATSRGNLAWANGDTTGFGIHADFVNGWDMDVLNAAIVHPQCGASNQDIPWTACPVFNQYYDTNAAANCQVEKGVLTESYGNADYVPIPTLPGCNPLWGATGAKPGCANPPAALNVAPLTGTQQSTVTDTPRPFTLPTTPGWSNVACVNNPFTLTGAVSYTDSGMTQESCQQSCLKQGQPYAAMSRLGASGPYACNCGSGFDVTTAYGAPGTCNQPCPGNSAEMCGGVYTWSLFYAPNGTVSNATAPSNSVGATYQGCLNTYPPQTTTYSFSSAQMTTEVCATACAGKGASFAATARGTECYCGTNLTSAVTSSYMPDSFCAKPCAGNSSEFCGDVQRSSVWSVANVVEAAVDSVRSTGYAGCFGTTATPYSYTSGDMTQPQCINSCGELGFQYGGLRAGNGCVCSNSTSAQTLPASQCMSPCAGLNTTLCGGPQGIDYYSTAGYATLASVGATLPRPFVGTFADGTGVLANYSYYSNGNTIESCIDGCGQMGYTYGGVRAGYICRCGNSLPTTQQVPTAKFATTACYGNTKEMCGGAQWIEVFQTTAASLASAMNGTTAGYKGCYQNSPNGLNSYYYATNDMTSDQCRTSCSELGYSLSGTDSGSYCRCSNAWTGGGLMPNNACNTACPGNATQNCGAKGFTSLYNAVGANSIQPRASNWLGCYQDNTSKRILSGYTYNSNYMTPDLCSSACKQQGYTLAGVEGAYQCYCGNSYDSTLRVPQVLCNSACVGAAGTTCGASFKVEIYNLNVTSITPAPSPSVVAANATTNVTVAAAGNASVSTSAASTATVAASSVGCYSDSSTLNGAAYTSDMMSLDICANWCNVNGGTYAGVKNGQTCQCGTKSPLQLMPSSACGIVCNAKAGQYCGGASAISVMKVTAASKLDPSGFLTSSNGTGYVGCFSSGSKSLLIPVGAAVGPLVTNDYCATQCRALSYRFTGTLNGNYCYCSNTVLASTGAYAVQGTNCNKQCAGDPTKTCGANGFVTVIDTLRAPASPPSPEGSKGCYAIGSMATTAGFNYTSNSNQPDTCRQTCRQKGYSVAAVWGAYFCSCSNTPSYGAVQAPAVCNLKCVGNSSLTCGSLGNTAANVYDTTGAGSVLDTSVQNGNAQYLGCVADPSNNLLTGGSYYSAGMNVGFCSSYCSGLGLPVYGLEQGNYCRCAASLPAVGLVPSTFCNKKCGGSTLPCGGNGYMSLFAKAGTVQNATSTLNVTATASATTAAANASTSAVANVTASVSGANASVTSTTLNTTATMLPTANATTSVSAAANATSTAVPSANVTSSSVAAPNVTSTVVPSANVTTSSPASTNATSTVLASAAPTTSNAAGPNATSTVLASAAPTTSNAADPNATSTVLASADPATSLAPASGNASATSTVLAPVSVATSVPASMNATSTVMPSSSSSSSSAAANGTSTVSAPSNANSTLLASDPNTSASSATANLSATTTAPAQSDCVAPVTVTATATVTVTAASKRGLRRARFRNFARSSE